MSNFGGVIASWAENEVELPPCWNPICCPLFPFPARVCVCVCVHVNARKQFWRETVDG